MDKHHLRAVEMLCTNLKYLENKKELVKVLQVLKAQGCNTLQLKTYIF